MTRQDVLCQVGTCFVNFFNNSYSQDASALSAGTASTELLHGKSNLPFPKTSRCNKTDLKTTAIVYLFHTFFANLYQFISSTLLQSVRPEPLLLAFCFVLILQNSFTKYKYYRFNISKRKTVSKATRSAIWQLFNLPFNFYYWVIHQLSVDLSPRQK